MRSTAILCKPLNLAFKNNLPGGQIVKPILDRLFKRRILPGGGKRPLCNY